MTPPSESKPDVGCATHIGPSHDVNQDAVAVASIDGLRLAVVCDGVSAGAHGDQASAVAARAALETLVHAAAADPAEALRTAVAIAHRAVCEADIEEVPGRDPPGTTLVAAVAGEGVIHVAWVGDSRAYLVPPEPDEPVMLTKDHSWVNLVVDAGDLTEEQALASRWAHVITHCVGPMENPDPYGAAIPSVARVESITASGLVLCSDGFWNVLPRPTDVAAALSAAPAGADAAMFSALLVRLALEAGTRDDVTVAVALL